MKEKKKSEISYLFRGLKEVNKASWTFFPIEFLSGSLLALHPFVNVYFMSKIVGEIMGAMDKNTLITLAILTVTLNFALFVAKNIFNTLGGDTFMRLILFEQNQINEVLLKADYSKIETTEFDSVLRKYREAKDMKHHLSYLVWMLFRFSNGLVGLSMCIVLLLPFFKASFTRADNSFIGSPYFALAIFAAMLALIIVIFFISKATNRIFRKAREDYLKLIRVMNYYVDLITNYKNGKDIRIFKAQNLIEEDATKKLLVEGVKIRKKSALSAGFNTSLIAVIGAVIGFGVYLLIGLKATIGAIKIDEIVLYMGTLMLFVQSVMAIFDVFGVTEDVAGTIKYYFDILDVKPNPDGDKTIDGINLKEAVIECKNVNFKYFGATEYALKNFSITIRGDEKIAIVGENGSGKTTFIKLLTRMYDDYEGEILINGVDIRQFKKDECAKLFSVVFQDYSIFSLTVGENVTTKSQSDPSLIESLDEAGIKNRIQELPNGVKTYLYRDYDESGIEISGGEGQKLALARALYKNAGFIILDEPAAALDPVAEYELYLKFNNFVKNKAAIYISHRLSSCRFCDKVAVFEKGELKQFGTHKELIKNEQGKYYELWYAQAQYYI